MTTAAVSRAYRPWQPSPLNQATSILHAACGDSHVYSGATLRRYDTDLRVCDNCGVPESVLPWMRRFTGDAA